MALRRHFIRICAAGLAAAAMVPAATVTITPGTTFQTFEGMGAFTGFPEIYRKAGQFYDARPMSYEYDRYAVDMGATAARFSLSAGCYPAKGTYFWAGLHGDIVLMKELKRRGCDKFLVSVWSPPGWMKSNGATINGGSLLSNEYDDFAAFMAQYCKVLKDSVGVEPYALSVQNEPRFVEPYESCVYNDAQLNQLVGATATKLQALGLTTRLVAAEDVADYGSFSATVSNGALWAAAVHNTSSGTAPAGKKLWLTEWDDTTTNIIGHASSLLSAFAGDFTYWTWFNYNNNCGDVVMDAKGVVTGFLPGRQYYPTKHFARFIRPGAVRVGCSASGVSAVAYRNADNTYAVVMVNSGAATTVNVSGVSGTWQVYQTSGASKKCAYAGTSSGTGIALDASGIVSLTSGSQIPTLGADTIKDSIGAPAPDNTPGLMNAHGDDILRLWINGNEIMPTAAGSYGFSDIKRIVSLKAGDNILACYVKNVAWGGGLLASMIVPGTNGSVDTLRTDGTWKVTYKNPTADAAWNALAFDDSKWGFAKDAGAVDMWPGFQTFGTSAVNMYYQKARWILGGSHTYFRKNITFSAAYNGIYIRGNNFRYTMYLDGNQVKTGTEFASCSGGCFNVGAAVYSTTLASGSTHCIAFDITDASADGNGVLMKAGVQRQGAPLPMDTTWMCSDSAVAGWNTQSFADNAWSHPDTINAYDPAAGSGNWIYPGEFWFRKKFTSAQGTQLLLDIRKALRPDEVVKVRYCTLQGREVRAGMRDPSLAAGTILVKRIFHRNGKVEEMRLMKAR